MLSRHRSENGQELVESALILPILILLLFGIIELAIVAFSYNTISDAAREGARYGAIHPTDRAGIEAAARKLTTGLDQAQLTVASSLPGGNVIQVDVTYDVHLITSLFMGSHGQPVLHLRAASTMQIE